MSLRRTYHPAPCRIEIIQARVSAFSRHFRGAFCWAKAFCPSGADLVPFPYLDVRPALPACLAKQGASLTTAKTLLTSIPDTL